METRREALRIIGAVGVTCAFPFAANELYGQHVHQPEQPPQEDVNPGAPFEPRFFTQTQFQVISRLADLIIPQTDTPGAVAAGVPNYIDLVVNEDPKLQAIVETGLRRLDAIAQAQFGSSSFSQSSEAQQVEILTSLSEAADRKEFDRKSKASGDAVFFQAIKNLTADGYYTSRVGLLQELGYTGNAALSSFPEFSIAEH
jgi:gluconate 2-dehydrogenase gamma chain